MSSTSRLQYCINEQYPDLPAMSRAPSASKLDLSTLPDVWRVGDLAPAKAVVATGHSKLDAALPGGGWPTGSLIEILQRTPAHHVWTLVLPALIRILEEKSGPAVLIGAPLQPFGPALSAQGLPVERLLCVHSDQPALRLWSTEQAVRCAQVAAVLAWLPRARNEELRRLHLAAQQQDRLLFVFRSLGSRHESSPAAVRLQVQGIDEIEIEILKRRGPPLLEPVRLAAGSRRLTALLQARRSSRMASSPTDRSPAVPGRSHVLDRTAAIQ
jgi:protein ImuA